MTLVLNLVNYPSLPGVSGADVTELSELLVLYRMLTLTQPLWGPFLSVSHLSWYLGEMESVLRSISLACLLQRIAPYGSVCYKAPSRIKRLFHNTKHIDHGRKRGSSTIAGLQWFRGSERDQHYLRATVV